MNSPRLSSDSPPRFPANVLVNLDGWCPIQCIATSALRAGNPIILACLYTVIIGLEAGSLETLEGLPTIIKCAPGFGKRHATNPGPTSQTARFAFDIHDAPSLCFRLLCRRHHSYALCFQSTTKFSDPAHYCNRIQTAFR